MSFVTTIQWRIQGGSLGQRPPQTVLVPAQNGAILIKMRPFLVPIEVETKAKTLSLN